MKHKIALLLCALAVAGSAYAAYSVRHGYDIQNAKNAAVKAAQTVKAELQAHQDAVKTQQEVNSLKEQCGNGVMAYELLTVAQRQHVVKPNCDL